MKKVKLKDILEEISREGIENLTFMAKMKKKTFYKNSLVATLGEPEYVECYIWQPHTNNELHNELYNFIGDYKMFLKAKDETYGKEDYYVSDFISLINSGHIKWIKTKH